LQLFFVAKVALPVLSLIPGVLPGLAAVVTAAHVVTLWRRGSGGGGVL